MKHLPKLLWLSCLVVFLIGFLPYKWPQFQIEQANEVIISKHECTGCPEFFVEEGTFNIPSGLKNKLPKVVTEITLEEGNELKKLDYNLVGYGNQFVVKASVIGVDSADFNPRVPINVKARVRVSDWAPMQYNPNLLTFSPKGMLVYLSILCVLFLAAMVSSLVKLNRKRKNKKV